MIIFRDRRDAGLQLAYKLQAYRGEDAVILALPRGGVVLGYEVAHALSLPLDILATRKIGHPTSPEYAIGVVDEHGMSIMNETETASLDEGWLKKEIKEEQEEARRRSILYRKGRGPLLIEGKTVILIDDGIATGYTMRLAVMTVRKRQPKKVIVATPVASLEAVSLLAEIADDIIVLEDSETFRGAVGLHYAEFDQVPDSEVVRLLHSIQTGEDKPLQQPSLFA